MCEYSHELYTVFAMGKYHISKHPHSAQVYFRPHSYNMCASHLVCMFTVISTGAYTIFQGLNLLFGRLSEEVVSYLFQTRWPQAATTPAMDRHLHE